MRQGVVVRPIRDNIKPNIAATRKPAFPASSSAAAASSSTDVQAVDDDDVFEVREGFVDHDLEAEVEDTLERSSRWVSQARVRKVSTRICFRALSLLIVKTRPMTRPIVRRLLSTQFDHKMPTQMSIERSTPHTPAASFVLPRREHDSRRIILSKLTATLCHWCKRTHLVAMVAQ